MPSHPELTYLIAIRDVLREYLQPAADWVDTPASLRVATDRDVIDVLPVSLVTAGFKVSMSVEKEGFTASIRYQRNPVTPSDTFSARGTGKDHYQAFADLHKSASRWLNRAIERLLEEEAQVAA